KAALPGAPVLEACVQDKKRARVEKEVVPAHVNKGVGQETPPLATLDIIASEKEGGERRARSQMQVEEKKGPGEEPKLYRLFGDHGRLLIRKGRDGSPCRHPPSSYSGCLSLHSK